MNQNMSVPTISTGTWSPHYESLPHLVNGQHVKQTDVIHIANQKIEEDEAKDAKRITTAAHFGIDVLAFLPQTLKPAYGVIKRVWTLGMQQALHTQVIDLFCLMLSAFEAEDISGLARKKCLGTKRSCGRLSSSIHTTTTAIASVYCSRWRPI